MIWTTAAQIGSGFALISFLASLALMAYRAKLKSEREQLEALPNDKRPDAARDLLNSYGYDTERLSRDQLFDLAMTALKGKHNLNFSILIAVTVVSLACIAFATYSLIPLPKPKPAKKDIRYAVCRHKDFGLERWEHDATYSGITGYVGGGHNPTWGCEQISSKYIRDHGIGPDHEVQLTPEPEESKDDWGTRKYNYHCKIRVQWGPIYAEKRDPRCGAEPG